MVRLGQMKCPNCGITRSTDLYRCFCGYNPRTGIVEKNYWDKFISKDEIIDWDKIIKIYNMNNEMSNKNLDTRHPFEVITDKMFQTYLKKNKDYGNSFDQSLDKWGLSVAAIRLGDKLNRFESFVKNGVFSVEDEGVRDTLSDMACYAIMTIMYLNAKGS